MTENATDTVFVEPGCCNGLETWRDWLEVLDGTGCASFGHDPSSVADRVGDIVRLTFDACGTDGSPVIELSVDQARRLVAGAQQDLHTMTSFLTHRAHVHDARLPLRRRHSALRTCITLFAPYGFRATYHHLTLSAAIPRRLEADPDALVRAVEELHAARVLWLARAEEYAAQRRAQKRAGRRAVANPRPWWLRSWWEGPNGEAADVELDWARLGGAVPWVRVGAGAMSVRAAAPFRPGDPVQLEGSGSGRT
ncbi:hypothetical protein ACFYWP_42285 [Actinacidiphila glaucinigra]|uniref:hypothetical protein n=1 Tax=Actinacidiphila glaucinigra TaxID=235986 RepID=UPI0036A6D727